MRKQKKKLNAKGIAVLSIVLLAVAVAGKATIDYKLVFNQEAGKAYGEKKAELEALDVAGAVVADSTDATNFNGIGLINAANKTQVNKLKCVTETLPKTSTTTAELIKNNSKENLEVTYVSIHQKSATGTPLAVSVGTSSVSAVPYNAGQLSTSSLPNGWIDRALFVSSTVDVVITNLDLGTSTLADATTADSAVRGDDVIGNTTAAGGNPALRIGRNNRPVGLVKPGEYFLAHLEVARYNDYDDLATSSIDRFDITACYRALSTSTPQ